MRAVLLFLAFGCAAGAWGGDLPLPADAGSPGGRTGLAQGPGLQATGAAYVVHGRFIQTKRVDGLSKALLSRGTFALLPGSGLVWRTLTPLRGTVVLTPKGIFSLDGAATRRLASGTESLGLMNEILNGNVGALERTFVVRHEGGVAGWRLSLVPRPGPLAGIFKSIEAEGAAFARQARLIETSGDETEIRFEGVQGGPGPLDRTEESLLGP